MQQANLLITNSSFSLSNSSGCILICIALYARDIYYPMYIQTHEQTHRARTSIYKPDAMYFHAIAICIVPMACVQFTSNICFEPFQEPSKYLFCVNVPLLLNLYCMSFSHMCQFKMQLHSILHNKCSSLDLCICSTNNTQPIFIFGRTGLFNLYFHK